MYCSTLRWTSCTLRYTSLRTALSDVYQLVSKDLDVWQPGTSLLPNAVINVYLLKGTVLYNEVRKGARDTGMGECEQFNTLCVHGSQSVGRTLSHVACG
jgi:hypothetical protein